jgi:excisionase family DNA binding protein
MMLPLLTCREAAAILHISRAHLYVLLNCGELVCFRFGRAVRIRQEDLDAYIRGAFAQRRGPDQAKTAKRE